MNAIISNNQFKYHNLCGHYQYVKHTCPACYGTGQMKCNHPAFGGDSIYSATFSLYGNVCTRLCDSTCIPNCVPFNWPQFYFITCQACNGSGHIWQYEWVEDYATYPVVTNIQVSPCNQQYQDTKTEEPCFKQGLGINKTKKCL